MLKIILSAIVTLGLSAAAFAEGTEGTPTPTGTEGTTPAAPTKGKAKGATAGKHETGHAHKTPKGAPTGETH